MPMKIKRVIRKYSEYFLTKIKLVFYQKKYKEGDITLKYILKTCIESKVLVVVFSSCTRKGIKARYNYMRTLRDFSVNKLFILDDFAEDHRGSYYLGEAYSFNEEGVTLDLINYVMDKCGIEKVIFCGSSKGGYSALNFGLHYKNSYIVAGGPQYYLGHYLVNSGNEACLKHILGTVTDEKIAVLDNRLKEKMQKQQYGNGQKIYLHYSDKEHTYEEHVRDLVKDLSENGYCVQCDIGDYTNHSDISYFFPDFLINTVSKLVLEK